MGDCIRELVKALQANVDATSKNTKKPDKP